MVSNRYWIPRPVVNSWYKYNWRDNYYYDDYSYDSYDDWYVERATTKAKRFSKKKTEKRHKSYIDKLMEEMA